MFSPSLTLPAAHTKRLAIVVPYRNRAEHLALFVPHLLRYFSQDKLDRQIEYQLHFIEQSDNKVLNRGAVKNVGFKLVKGWADYVCFHDIDYLPVWADYSYPSQPARLIWHGLAPFTTQERAAEAPPLPENYRRFLGATQASFFGGVVMFTIEDFERVNGYSNEYWGWGPEDAELRMRCDIMNLRVDRRDGTYEALPHEHNGFVPGTLDFNQQALSTHARLLGRIEALPKLMQQDGLNSVQFKHKNSGHLTQGTKTLTHIHVHRVEL